MPKSSGLTLICRRSMARIVSFSIGMSYFLPVRLSVIESVSGMIVVVFVGGHRFAWNPVLARQPSTKVGHLAALAAEGSPGRVNRAAATIHAHPHRGHQDIL